MSLHPRVHTAVNVTTDGRHQASALGGHMRK